MGDEYEISNIIDILYSMKEDIRRKIFQLIFSSDDEGISFKSIVNEGNIPPTTAAYHLKILSRSGIIEKNYNNLDGRRDYSFYNTTPMGDRAYFMVHEIYKELNSRNNIDKELELPDIQIIPLRYGPRCISIEKITG